MSISSIKKTRVQIHQYTFTASIHYFPQEGWLIRIPFINPLCADRKTFRIAAHLFVRGFVLFVVIGFICAAQVGYFPAVYGWCVEAFQILFSFIIFGYVVFTP